MHRGSLALSIVLALFGAWYLSVAAGYPRGTMAQPGPGLYALLVGALIVLASAGTAVEAGLALRAGGELRISWPKPDGLGRIAGLLAGALAYLVLLGNAGHLIAAFIACVLIMRSQGDGNWLRVLLCSAALAGLTYYGFVVLLGVIF